MNNTPPLAVPLPLPIPGVVPTFNQTEKDSEEPKKTETSLKQVPNSFLELQIWFQCLSLPPENDRGNGIIM